MGFTLPLFQGTESTSEPETKKRKSTPKKKKQDLERGCEHCSLNKKGIKKIFGTVDPDKDIIIFAQSPGPDENREGKELIGRSGEWWWSELKRVGIFRKECSVQNVVRCLPADVEEDSYGNRHFKMRNPSKDEIRCCSIYTEQALEKVKGKTKHYLLLGKIAQNAVLGRSIPKQRIFWSDKLDGRVYLLDHPSFFIRGYANAERLNAFRNTLDELASSYKSEGTDLSDSFAFIKSQDYRLVTTEAEALKAEHIIRKHASKGRRVACDIENDTVDDQDVMICCGMCPKPGLSFVFVFQHKDCIPEGGLTPSKEEKTSPRGSLGGLNTKVIEVAKRILEDQSVKKVFQYGCTDTTKLKKMAGINVKGYDHDTNLSEYLRFPDRKAYGLEATVNARFLEFSGYWTIIAQEMLEGVELPKAIANSTLQQKTDYIYKNHLVHMAKLSLDTLRLYNGADCDVTKRIEVSNKKQVNPALLRLYIDLSYVLMEMESNGPDFDYEQAELLSTILPARAEKLKKQLRTILGDEDYNPGSPQQVHKALYETLDLQFPFKGKPNTQKLVLQTLARHHDFPRIQLEWRTAEKGKSTYVVGYKTCADNNGGRLRTRWWSTGTRTGRLSSGGDKEKKGQKKIINLQNIHNNPHIRNMCVSDVRWRRAYNVVAKLLKKYGQSLLAYWAACDKEQSLAKKEKRKPNILPPSATVDKERKLVAEKVVKWLQVKMPDLQTFLVLDYGQIEIRVAAQLSGDKNLIADCMDSDIHTKAGCAMTGWDAELISKNKQVRTSTKTVHFGTLFGSNAEGTHNFVVARTPPEDEPVTLEFVAEAQRRYFERYSGIKKMIDRLREFGRVNKYVETMFGMKQPLNVIESHRDEEEGEEEQFEDEGGDKRGSWWGNQAVNGPVQGSAHQLLTCGLVNIKRKRKTYQKLNIPVADVHDALDFRVNVLDLPECFRLSKQLMEQESLATVKKDFPDINWVVPIFTEAEAGLTLGCAIEIGEDVDPGMFLIEWYRKRHQQSVELNKELASITS